MKRITESQLNRLVKKIVKEADHGNIQNYMFFSNLEQIKRQAELLLELDPMQIEQTILRHLPMHSPKSSSNKSAIPPVHLQ